MAADLCRNKPEMILFGDTRNADRWIANLPLAQSTCLRELIDTSYEKLPDPRFAAYQLKR
jgi:hypothetical protein